MIRRTLLIDLWSMQRMTLCLLLGLILLVAAMALFDRFQVEPSLVQLRSEQLQLQQTVRERSQEALRSGGLPVSAQARLERNLEQFNALIPPAREFSVFLGELFEWSEKSGLLIRDIRYRPERLAEQSLFYYHLQFTIKSSYANIKHFIHQLETAPRLLYIDRLSINTASVEDSETEVSLSIELTTLFREQS